jgi:pimeloyl-ACP methyl ester carboxylesterase
MVANLTQIEPSRHLEYTPCFGHFQCARLEVPLNWNSSNSDGPTAAIAIIRLPAKVPVTDPQYGGAVVLNPGGPGESGIHQVLTGGSYIQTILDSPTSPTPTSNGTARFFDIISFDPRGVNNTTPRLKCYPNAYDQQNWILKLPDYGLLWDSEAVLGLEWARAEAQGKSCSQGDPENDMIRFVNTAQVVEDMVAIVEQHGGWREKEAAKELATIPRISSAEKETALSRTRWKVGEEMLQYWGVSYGTLLGATFAAMHPERVQRMVLDGNLNPEDYYSGARLKNLRDSDMIITKFCEYCFLAGPDACPLYTGTSVSDVEARLTRIMLDLRSNPIPVLRESGGPEVVLYGDMHLFGLLTAMYFPSTTEHFFSLLSDAEHGNASWVAEIKQAWFRPMEVSQRCLEDGAFSEACISGKDYLAGFGPEQSIACMDQGGKGNFTKEDFWDYWKEVQDQSRWISRSWARGRIACVGYTVEPGWRFEGPYGGETAYPMLLIGNSHDTVTPLAK